MFYEAIEYIKFTICLIEFFFAQKMFKFKNENAKMKLHRFNHFFRFIENFSFECRFFWFKMRFYINTHELVKKNI